MTINTSHANIAGHITNDTLDTVDVYYTRGKLIPIAITILVILI